MTEAIASLVGQTRPPLISSSPTLATVETHNSHDQHGPQKLSYPKIPYRPMPPLATKSKATQTREDEVGTSSYTLLEKPPRDPPRPHKPGGNRILPRPNRLPPWKRHHAVRDAIPLGPPAGMNEPRTQSAEGDSSAEHLFAAHSLLLAHARVVQTFRRSFKAKFDVQIGITLNEHGTPLILSTSPPANVKLKFAISWFADTIYFSHYSASMREQLGDRLPEFTPKESALVKGSNDFYGMNYTTNYIRHLSTLPHPHDHLSNFETSFTNKPGTCIGPETQSTGSAHTQRESGSCCCGYINATIAHNMSRRMSI
ncbi:glycoside hydrolase superfamily [Trichophaea hybrida]|nr:glycoside hydrolase superfamily [Trichophaea hybrida]